MNPPDVELIARVVATDDRVAFGELVQRHQSAVRRFLRHLTSGDAALADDLAQETFVQAYRGLARFRGDANFATWLRGIAHNHWRNARRRARRTQWVTENELPDEAAPSPARAIELKHDLAQALGALSPDEQTAVHLCYQQGLSHNEIATVLDWPLGTVKTHLARGRDRHPPPPRRMEPANVNSPPPDEAQFEAWMRRNAATAPLPDAGFSARVLTALPPRRAPFAWRRTLLCVAGAAVGAVLARSRSGSWPTLRVVTEPLRDAAQTVSAVFADPWVGASLAIIAMVATGAAAVVLALRDDESAESQL